MRSVPTAGNLAGSPSSTRPPANRAIQRSLGIFRGENRSSARREEGAGGSADGAKKAHKGAPQGSQVLTCFAAELFQGEVKAGMSWQWGGITSGLPASTQSQAASSCRLDLTGTPWQKTSSPSRCFRRLHSGGLWRDGFSLARRVPSSRSKVPEADYENTVANQKGRSVRRHRSRSNRVFKQVHFVLNSKPVGL